MGLENPTNSRIIFTKKNEAIEITSQKSENCDSDESYTVDYLWDCITPERICDIVIDVAKISVLDLSHCNLTTLPVECQKLNLKHLSLSHNNLKEIPLCLYSGLKSLKSLDLSHNSIERFDIEPECLQYVKVIKLNNNCFENIPKWFLMFKCINLEEFNYSHNKSAHYKYSKNSINLNTIKLRKLELMNNYLIDEDYTFLKCFKFLKYLDISNSGLNFFNKFNELDDLFVKPRWKELYILKLNNLSLSIFPEGIAWIYSLKELHLANNSLSWLPDSIEFLVNLEVLDISYNSVIAVTQKILSLEKLTTLRAPGNHIDVIPDFSKIPGLTTVDLYNNYLDDISFSISNFKLIDLEDNYYNTKNLEYLPEYEEKKDSLRRMFEVESRYDGPKQFSPPPESPPYDPEKDDVYGEIYTNAVCVCSTNIEEDWDVPVKVKNKNPDIDSVDDQWRGEENKRSTSYKSEYKVYVSDDDWMFADFEENV